MKDETKGLGIAYLAFAKSVADLAPDVFRQAINLTYAELDKEADRNRSADLQLGYEFTEIAETLDNGSIKPSVLLKRLRDHIATEGKP